MLNDYAFYSDRDTMTCATHDTINFFKESDAYDERLDNYGRIQFDWKNRFIANIDKTFVNNSSSILSSKELPVYKEYTDFQTIFTETDLGDDMTKQLDAYLATITTNTLPEETLCPIM